MPFIFGEKEGDPLMSKIHMRDIGSHTRQWDHPIKGLLKYSQAMKECGNDILKLPKKDRERYCISLIALALKNDSQMDWWTNIPTFDPPDGLVMTLAEEPGASRGLMREIEVVEHRGEQGKVVEIFQNKLTKKFYDPNTILVCLGVTTGVYNFEVLSTELKKVRTTLKHAFIIFAGIPLNGQSSAQNNPFTSFTMVQLLPEFSQSSFDLIPHLSNFQEKYNKGQESLLIEGDKIFFGTANPKFIK